MNSSGIGSQPVATQATKLRAIARITPFHPFPIQPSATVGKERQYFIAPARLVNRQFRSRRGVKEREFMMDYGRSKIYWTSERIPLSPLTDASGLTVQQNHCAA